MVATMTATYDAVTDAATVPAFPVQAALAADQGASGGGAGRPGAVEAIVVRIDARDPISEAGVRMQLRSRPEIQIARAGQLAAYFRLT